MEEIWKDIKNYEGMYQVSSLGRVRSLDRYVNSSEGRKQFIKGKILKLCYNQKINMYEIHLRKNNKRKCFKVHRLVAEAFIKNDDPINKTTINHKDGNRKNNSLENLEWVSYSQNLKHAYNKLNRPINKPKYSRRKCLSINKITKEQKLYKSIAEASRNCHISETQIRRIAMEENTNKNYEFYIEGLNDFPI